MRTRLAVVIVLVAVLGGLALFARSETTHEFVVEGGIDVVEVAVESGDVEVVPGEARRLAVRRATSRGVRLDEHVRAPVIRLEASCRRFILVPCYADYSLEAPPDAQVRVRASEGSVRFDGALGGALRADTESGDVHLGHLGGPVTVRTTSGSVRGDDVAVPSLDAATESGDITLTMTHPAPDVLVLVTTSGSIDVVVPDGTYRIDTQTSGTVEVDVPTHPEAERVITARSESGHIRFRTAGGAAGSQPS